MAYAIDTDGARAAVSTLAVELANATNLSLRGVLLPPSVFAPQGGS